MKDVVVDESKNSRKVFTNKSKTNIIKKEARKLNVGRKMVVY